MLDTENLTRFTLSRTLPLMPAALDVDREAVKTLAVAIGVREAARQMGLNEDTVRQWSCRESWFAPTPKPATMQPQTVTDVTKPSVALANVLADDSLHTRVGFSKAARKVATHLGDKEPSTLVERDTAQSARQWAEIAKTTHGWDAKQGEAGVNVAVNIGIIGA